jgi:hypothetical protein
MKPISKRASFIGLGLIVLAGSLFLAAQAAASGNSDLDAVRKANNQFHVVAKAEAAGYQKFLDCFDLPGVGGMGQHFVKLDSLDANLDPLKPEAMVYEVKKNGGLQLGAVEYIVPVDKWSGEDPPELFGQSFSLNRDLNVWVLHAWIWQKNPLGIFQNFNPRIPMCP